MECFSFESCVRGYHVYKDIWKANDGEQLPCQCETSNRSDPFAVAIVKSGGNCWACTTQDILGLLSVPTQKRYYQHPSVGGWKHSWGENFRDSHIHHENNETWHPTKITRYMVFQSKCCQKKSKLWIFIMREGNITEIFRYMYYQHTPFVHTIVHCNHEYHIPVVGTFCGTLH